MIEMKKFVALVAASLMMTSITVSAAGSPTAAAVVASQPAYASEGFSNASDQQAAAEYGMSAGEYYNNVVVTTPGVENAYAVGQGGKIMVNGVATNLTASLFKVNAATSKLAKDQANTLGGTLLNVVSVKVPGNFTTATVNFYVKGLATGTKVAAKQYVGGTWIDVEVVEARADHVVLNLKGNGPVAFVALP
jgi:hypothetical protein